MSNWGVPYRIFQAVDCVQLFKYPASSAVFKALVHRKVLFLWVLQKCNARELYVVSTESQAAVFVVTSWFNHFCKELLADSFSAICFWLLNQFYLQGTVLGILSGQQSLFTQHLTPQQQQMYQQHMQLQHQAQHLKKIRRSLPHSAPDQTQQIHQQVGRSPCRYLRKFLSVFIINSVTSKPSVLDWPNCQMELNIYVWHSVLQELIHSGTNFHFIVPDFVI